MTEAKNTPVFDLAGKWVYVTDTGVVSTALVHRLFA
jgi:hypothetical protein